MNDPMIPDDFVWYPQHRVIHYEFDDDGTSAYVCEACSDPEDGLWVPASFCPEAKADMEKRNREYP